MEPIDKARKPSNRGGVSPAPIINKGDIDQSIIAIIPDKLALVMLFIFVTYYFQFFNYLDIVNRLSLYCKSCNKSVQKIE